MSAALCCPSRARFLSGQYAHNHGVLTNTNTAPVGDPPNGGCAALDESSTLATWLKDPLLVGTPYTTGIVGKYLNQYGSDWQAPYAQPCFDPHHVADGWDTWQVLAGRPDSQGNSQLMRDFWVSENGTPAEWDDSTWANYQTYVVRDYALDFIRVSAPLDGSFFLYVAPTAPHLEVAVSTRCSTNFGGTDTIRTPPWIEGDAEAAGVSLPRETTVPSFNEADVSDKPDYIENDQFTEAPRLLDDAEDPDEPDDIECTEIIYRARVDSMEVVDNLIGRIVNELDVQGVLDETVVIFTSDNGYYHGEHRLQQKRLPYEEAIRVPLYVRHHDAQDYGQNPPVDDHFIVNTDLAPTIADLAGINLSQLSVDGRSFRGFLPGETPPASWRNRFQVQHWTGDPTPTGAYATFRGIRSAGTASSFANTLYVRYATSTEQFEYYENLHLDNGGQSPDKWQMENTYGSGTCCATLDTLLTIFATCGSEPGQTSCQSLEDQ